MKVILLRDVARLGKKGAVVEVPNGYAQNQLIPSKSAEPATPQNLAKLQRKQAVASADVAAKQANFKEVVASLRENKVTLTAEANEKDHLFKAVSQADVTAALAEQGIVVGDATIVFPQPVKTLGEHEITLKQGSETANFTIVVTKK